MRPHFGTILKRFYIADLGTACLNQMRLMRRRALRYDSKLEGRYFAEHPVKKLHVGCGTHLLSGWLNTNIFPQSPFVLHLDATTRFPFATGLFDYAFSEHMIEHITYEHGLRMLAECYRVLKPGGKIRIATPDLAFLVDLYGKNKSPLQMEYIEFATKECIPYAPYPLDTFVVNHFMRGFGHQFVYDFKTLEHSLVVAGFTAITKQEVRASRDEHLSNLENEGRMPAGFLKLETIILEAVKG